MLNHRVSALAHPIGPDGAGRTQAQVTQEVRIWTPDLEIESVELEEDGDRLTVEVALTGSTEPPPASDLAALLADGLGRPVTAEVVFVPTDVAHSDPE